MIRSFYLLTSLLFLNTICFSQVSFKALPEANQVLQGSYFTIDFILSNDEINDFKAPDFDGFNIVAGPIQSSSFQSINGARSSQIKITYSLVADRQGVKIIKPAVVQTKNSGTLKTLPVKIRVAKRKQGVSASQKKVYARMTISDSTAVVGQQLFINYTLYHSVKEPVRDIELRREDKFSIFDAVNLNNQDLSSRREIIDGIEYYVQVVAVRSLVPLETGEYTISAAQLNTYYEGSRRSRFGFSRTNAVPVITNDLKINIRNIPLQNKPEDFCGAIGNYSLKSTINKNQSKVEEAISLKLTISGDGDPKNLIAPRFKSTDSLEIYDPQLISEKSYSQQGKALHYKLYEYLLVPKIAGLISFQPYIQVYSTVEDSFKRLEATRHQIRVSPRTSSYATTTTEDMELGISPIIQSTTFSTKKSPLISTLFYTIALAAILALALLFSLYKYYKSKKPELDYKKFNYDNAGNVALKQLANAKIDKDNHKVNDFYNEVNRALLNYIANKLDIESADLSKSNLNIRLNELNISKETASDFIEIINKVELSLFAGTKSFEDLDHIYNKAIETIKVIENQINTAAEIRQ